MGRLLLGHTVRQANIASEMPITVTEWSTRISLSVMSISPRGAVESAHRRLEDASDMAAYLVIGAGEDLRQGPELPDHLAERREPEHVGLARVDSVFVDHLHESGSHRAAMPCSNSIE